MQLLDQFGRPWVEKSGTRADSWQNLATGIGTFRDKTTLGSFWTPWRVLDAELTALYSGSDLAAKIIEKPVDEMLSQGYDLTADGVDASAIEDLREDADERLNLDVQLYEGMKWGRTYGGCLLLLGLNDGQKPDKPLNEDRIQSVDFVNVLDRRFSWIQSYYADPLSPKYGQPEVYLITNAVSTSRPLTGSMGTSVIHESRTIRFDGITADVLTRQQLAGWSWSVLQRVYDTMKRFDHAFDSVGALLSDAAQAVYKLQGLISMIAAGQTASVQQRMALMDESRSTIRAIVLDSEQEDFVRTATPLGGAADILDRMMMRLAAAADIPVTELFGRSAAGLNATGDNDTRKWYKSLQTQQTKYLGPKIRRLYNLIAKAGDSPIKKKDLKFEIKFVPLWSPTDAEQAETDYKTAQKDQIYMQEGVVSPEEVALDRQDQYPSMDVESREKAAAGAKKFDPYENDPNAASGVGGQPQAPAVPIPLPAAPSLPGKSKADGQVLLEDSKVADILLQLQEDYPDDALGWVKAAKWWGPRSVPLDEIDFSKRDSWMASKDDLSKYVEDIQNGKKKPIILVDIPGRSKYLCVDGHHRLLAYERMGKSALAYCATVSHKEGPWDEFHSQQKHAPSM